MVMKKKLAKMFSYVVNSETYLADWKSCTRFLFFNAEMYK